MSDTLILQAIAFDETLWQVYHCKILSSHVGFDENLPVWQHYDRLDDEIKVDNPIDKTMLLRLNDNLNTTSVAKLLNIDEQLFKKAWQIKYIGRAVLFCESLQIAVRFYFSNTAKQAQVVYVADRQQAVSNEVLAWQAFGVVDVAYKGTIPLISVADDTVLVDTPSYSHLPSEHSLAILQKIHTQKDEKNIIFQVLTEQIYQAVIAFDDN